MLNKITDLKKIMPNLQGPNYFKRRTLLGVVHYMMLHGPSIWHSILSMNKYKNLINSILRSNILRVIKGFRTISMADAQDIARVIKIHLLAQETHMAHETRRKNELMTRSEIILRKLGLMY